MSSNAKALLETAKASPTAVAAHDKQTWLDLFAADAQVRDPFGSRPHTTPAALGRFYETFIAPNNIRFVVEQDVVCGDTVVRDVTIMTKMPTGLVVGVPTHIRYEMVEAGDGSVKIRRLFAHWELLVLVLQTLTTGWIGWRTYGKLSWRMLRCQGLGGVFGFMRGFMGVGGAGKRRAEAFLTALAQGDTAMARHYLPRDYKFELAAQHTLDLPALLALCHGITWRKVIAAGRYVSASISLGTRAGVVFLEIDHRKRVVHAIFYLSES